MIPSKGFVFKKQQGENHKYGQGNHFLNDLKLH